ncbi:hypothetical protein BV22DRAFT_1133083 [Leucogyrophana mollusca]|uniref:Uncharacterized protein n=1 Tax=Leucogyrophana mollusca TaxID=85980 RepID=A0ACB8B4F7_9AGAM|nr:hypothetical protein BV22DRAFT_1133083 [Leucogyrophana mollusca]
MVQTRSAGKKLVDAYPRLIESAPQSPDYHSESESEEDTHRAQKRRKPSKASNKKSTAITSKGPVVKKRRGRLEMMPTMNLDVLFQILSLLHPMDLLNLARTTQAFRHLLMRKSSAFVWKTARLQIEGFPDCPPDLSEPAYANLAFYPHCHSCGKIAYIVLWRFRVRYCAGCKQRKDVDFYDYPRRDIPRGVLPVAFRGNSSRRQYHTSDYVSLCEALDKPDSNREEILSRFSSRTAAINEMTPPPQHADLCESWQRSNLKARKTSLRDVRDSRRLEIMAWLEDTGFKPEIDFIGAYRFAGHAIFKESQALNNRTWPRVRSILTNYMTSIRERRLEKTVYSPRCEQLVLAYKLYMQHPAPPGAAFEYLPHVADLSVLPEFDNVITLPEDVVVGIEMFTPGFAQIPSFVPRWREAADRELANFCLGTEWDSGTHADAVKRLQLASSVFSATGEYCEDIAFYPQILSHHCLTQVPLKPYSGDGDSLTSLRWSALGGHPWGTMKLGVSLLTAAASVVRVCGLDPEHATQDDMDKRDARLVCERCSTHLPGGERMRKSMTWRAAIAHSRRWHPGPVTWTILEDETDLARVRSLEAAALPREYKKMYHHTYSCTLCQRSCGDAGRWEYLQQHLIHRHGIPENELNADKPSHCIPLWDFAPNDPLPVDLIDEGSRDVEEQKIA